MEKLNNVTNDLILQYDETFNELYNKKLNVNTSITNKEEIILKMNDEIDIKNNTIFLIECIIVLVVLFGIILILYGINKIDFTKFIILSVVLIIIYIIIYYRSQFKTLEHEVKVDMATYVASVIENNLPYKCPATCPPKKESNTVSTVTIQGFEQPTLSTDPQLNVWQTGDIAQDLYTSVKNPASNYYSNVTIPNYTDTLEEHIDNSPKPTFNSTYPMSTYYQCQWQGGNSNSDLPNIESKKYSTIPCSYRPNFSETARYICRKDPNTLSSNDNFNQYCDNIYNSGS